MVSRPGRQASKRAATGGRPPASALPIAVTAGEPAGIGPELCVALAGRRFAAPIVVVADEELLLARARFLGVRLRVQRWTAGSGAMLPAGTLCVHHVPLARASTPGRLDCANSRYVLRTLDEAITGCRSGVYGAMVTAPVQKSVINEAGIAFTGHTEYLAERTGVRRPVMMLVGGGMRVALATTHVALRDVPGAITRESLAETLEVLHADLIRRFGIARPRILVAGLNPHAGESGYLGREEIEVIGPVVEALQRAGRAVEGPIPADTLFHPRRLRRCDCVLAMYHDQGLPVLKHASFGAGVNVTLGLPLIRTSVDHGTALDLAGSGRADAGSLVQAVQLAARLARAQPGDAKRRAA